MNPSDPLPDARARVQRAWLGDGLTDLVLALYFLLPGLFYVGLPWFPPKSAARGAFVVLMTAVLMAGPWLARWAVIWLRNRLFAARSGYSVPAGPALMIRHWSLAPAAGLFAVLVVLVLRGAPDWAAAALLAGAGIGGGAIVAAVGWKAGLRRYVVLGALFACGGIAAAGASEDLGQGFAVLYFWCAGLLVVNGVASLLLFLRSHPPVNAEEAQ